MRVSAAWYIDDGIVLEGIYARGLFIRPVFVPRKPGCGFSSQRIWRKDIGYKLFFSQEDAERANRIMDIGSVYGATDKSIQRQIKLKKG